MGLDDHGCSICLPESLVQVLDTVLRCMSVRLGRHSVFVANALLLIYIVCLLDNGVICACADIRIESVAPD